MSSAVRAACLTAAVASLAACTPKAPAPVTPGQAGARFVGELVVPGSVGTFEGFAAQLDLVLDGPNGFHEEHVALSYTNLNCDPKGWERHGRLAPPGSAPVLAAYCEGALNSDDTVVLVVQRGDMLVLIHGELLRYAPDAIKWSEHEPIPVPPGAQVEAKR